MQSNNLKLPLIISIMFHSAMLFSIAAYLPNVKETVMDITAVEVLKIPVEKEVVAEPQTEEKREKPKPLPERKIEKVEEIKKEIPPVEKREEVKSQEAKVEQPPLPSVEKKEEPVEKANTAKNVELPPPFAKPAVESSNIKTADTLKSADTVIKAADGVSRINEAPVVSTNKQIRAEAKPQEHAGSKYGLEGGTGKGTEDELKLFKTMVRTKIERAKFYPRWARQRGYEGVVGVKFTIQPDGSVNDVKVTKPCHCDVLNKAACEAIMKAAPFNPRPDELNGKEMAMEIDISFKLE